MSSFFLFSLFRIGAVVEFISKLALTKSNCSLLLEEKKEKKRQINSGRLDCLINSFKLTLSHCGYLEGRQLLAAQWKPKYFFLQILISKVEIILEQRYVAFLSPSKICENLNFSGGIQIFPNFAGS